MFTPPASVKGPIHNVSCFGCKPGTREVEVLCDVGQEHHKEDLDSMLNEVYGISWTLSMLEQGKEEDLQHVDITDRHVQVFSFKTLVITLTLCPMWQK